MKSCEIHKSSRKWSVYADGTVVYTDNSRVKCFRWAAENGYKVVAYGHGEK